jgi:prolyl 4-hydroxylase
MGASHHHGVVPPAQRVAVDASCGSLRSAAQYAALGGKNLTARSGGTGIKRAQPWRAQDADPLICTFDEVVGQHEADAVIAHCERRMRRARVTPDSGKGGEASAGRTNYSTWLRHDSDPCVAAVVQKIVALVGRPAATAEALQVIHYSETQQYRQHWDAYCPDARGKAACANGGNRLVTALLYLRQPNGGGGTYFPHLDIRVQPIQRSLLVFHNCYPGSRTPHPDSKHAGEPVTRCDAGIMFSIHACTRKHRLAGRLPRLEALTVAAQRSGEKWACNLWFRETVRVQALRAPRECCAAWAGPEQRQLLTDANRAIARGELALALKLAEQVVAGLGLGRGGERPKLFAKVQKLRERVEAERQLAPTYK